MKTICRFELRRGRTTTLIFTAVCAGLLIFVMAIYPLFKDMLGDMSAMMADMGEFAQIFSMDELDYGSAQDYYATEGSLVLALCGSILAAFLGGAILGREESERTGEWLLTHPISRGKVFFGKILSVITLVFILNTVCALASGVLFPIINEPLNIKTFALFFIAQFAMHMEIASISLLLSAVMKRNAGPIGLGIAMIMYFLSLIAAALEELEFITYVTPFSYSDAATIFLNGEIDIVKLGIGLGITAVCGISAYAIWCRKDISA